MISFKTARNAAVAGILALGAMASMAAPAQAAEEDVALIKAYVGKWIGRGSAHFADQENPESIQCRMDVKDADQIRIHVDSRCSLASVVVKVGGTLAYNQNANQYEAIVNAGSFTGTAVGERRGKSLVFQLRDYTADNDSTFDVDASLALDEGAIALNLNLRNKDTGGVTTASVPFARR